MNSTISVDLRTRIAMYFEPLKNEAASLPPPLALSKQLAAIAPSKSATSDHVNVSPDVAKLFATASVEIWQRAIQSFLISVALTQASPIWACVCGYYSSHYSVRAIAHLLGYFQLYVRGLVVQISFTNGQHTCTFKKGRNPEHRVYWSVVKHDPHFTPDPLFRLNDEKQDISDAGHRGLANYGDHANRFPVFRLPDEETIRDRVDRISKIQFATPPIPDRNRFPDVESVQIVAYQRIVRYRRLLDDVLGGRANRFWTVHRTPTWTLGILSFQLVEQENLGTTWLAQ